MRIISADSSAAILNGRFEPQLIVATASVLTVPPYREAKTSFAEPIFVEVEKGHDVIVHEAELCRDLLGKTKADIVHLDMSFGGVSLEQLSPIQLGNREMSAKAKRHLLSILPRLRRIANEMTQKYGVDVLAIGKESMPVRVAELTSGAHAILYACKTALNDKKTVLLGLPSRCQPRSVENAIYLYSLMAAEHDVRGFAKDEEEILKKVNISEFLNPVARGFRGLKISRKENV